MRYARLAALPLVFLVSRAPVALAAAEESPRQPYQLVRTLQALQDGIASGTIEAHSAHLAMLKHIGEKFLSSDPGVWGDRRNGRAAITFLLSGGSPDIIKKLPNDLAGVDAKLRNGALAYVEGRENNARDLLSGFEPRGLPATLGGHVALVQSALLARVDPEAAIERLDEARLLMPGTLVEEAALRREIFLVGQADKFDKFEFLTLAYTRRFPNSVYAGDFWRRYALALTRFSFTLDESRFSRIGTMSEQLDEASQLKFYLLVARTALVRGKLEMAKLAGERALVLAAENDVQRERAHLYRGSARVISDNFDGGLAELKDIDKSKLPDRDARLLNAALELAENVRKPLWDAQQARAEPLADNTPPPSMPPGTGLDSSTATIEQARKKLGESDLLLKERRE